MPGSRYGAQDLGPFGITAKCITPGVIASGGIMAMVIPGSIQSSRYRAELARVTPARDGRGLRKVVEFLATDLSDHVTGHRLGLVRG